jgi:hypothetical protein
LQANLRSIEFEFTDGIDPTDFALAPEAEGSKIRACCEPERNLLLAVLTDAILHYRALATTPEGTRRRELAESERWILSNERDWPFSFLNVCEALGIEPQPLRRGLVRWRGAHQRESRIALKRAFSARRQVPRGNA